MADQTVAVTRLRTLPGGGLLTATALVATGGGIQRFPSGRHFASYLGLTPRERSSDLRRQPGKISKRGDTSLRMLLIHGARDPGPRQEGAGSCRLRAWALQLERGRGHNKAEVALANQVARIAWAVRKTGKAYTNPATA